MVRVSFVPVLLGCLCLAGCSPNGSRESVGSGGSAGNGGTAGKGGSGGNAGNAGLGGGGGSSSRGGSTGNGGQSGSGGSSGSGGATGGTTSGGGSSGNGGSSASGGKTSSGGSSGNGGSTNAGGNKATGGTTASGGITSSGGTTASGGTMSTGGNNASGGSTGTGSCSITVTTSAPSSKIGTVGIVEWSTTLAGLNSAKIVYTLNNAGSTILNKGGTAPVDLKKTNYHTLLLGLKPSSTYTFHVEATSSSGTTCKSSDGALTTGTLSGAPTITRTSTNATAQANGFIVTSGGQNGKGASIIDADGTVVWYADAPNQCSRALMDYEGVNMWMMALNVQNGGGEMRYVSMDGQTTAANVSGLSSAHHDFTVLPGKIATMVWTSTGMDPESNLVERASDGTGSTTTVFKIGSNLYAGGSSAFGGGSNTYHCNAIHYHPADDSYTIGDRNPNLYVKVKHDGTPVWQIGGSCTGAKAPKCASGTWQVNHGHDFDSNGNMLIFNNGQSGASHVFELKLTESSSAITTTSVKDFAPGTTSNVLGDVQRLPNGNTLVTFSTAGQILEVDASWATVQTLKGSFGYADWRETLYGAPTRD